MTSSLLSRSLLSVALLGSLAACSSSDQEAPKNNDKASAANAPAVAQEEQAAPAKPRLTPEQEARIKDITVDLRPDSISDAFEIKTTGEARYVDLKPGDKFLFCIGNKNKEAALVSVSLQGENIDLVAAHTHKPLLRLNGLTTRCLPEVTAVGQEDSKPAVVAWNVFLAEGEDGSSIQDTSVVPAQSGLIWIGQPGDAAKVEAWPGLNPKPETEPQPPVGPAPYPPLLKDAQQAPTEPASQPKAEQDQS